MPIFYKIDKDRKLVVSTGSGFVTKMEALAHQDQVLNDPDLTPASLSWRISRNSPIRISACQTSELSHRGTVFQHLLAGPL